MKRATLWVSAFVCLFPLTAWADDAPDVTRKEDVIYGRKYGVALTLDVFQPKEPNGAGVIIAISGGFFSSHDSINPIFALPFTKRGYTVFAVVHGSQPKFTVPEIIEDMHRAVRFIRHNAKDYKVDPERLGIMGASAGGHLSLMMGASGRPADPKAKDPVDRDSSRVAAVACFFPPTDFLNWGKEGKEMLGGKPHAPPYRAAFHHHELDKDLNMYVEITDEKKLRAITKEISPITHVTADDPPTLIMHGDKDDLVPVQQSEIMVKKLKDAGVTAELIIKKGEGHGWGLKMFTEDLPTFADWFDKHLAKKK